MKKGPLFGLCAGFSGVKQERKGDSMKRLLILTVLFLLIAPAALSERLNSWEEVQQAFSRALDRQAKELTLTLSSPLLKEMDADPGRIRLAGARGGYGNFALTWWTNGKVEVTGMEPFGCPFQFVRGEDGMTAAIQEMKLKDVDRFVLLFEPEDFARLQISPVEKHVLQMKSGLYDCGSGYYNEKACWYEYVSCRYWDGTVREVRGEAEALSAMQEIGGLGYDAFALVLDRETYTRLMASDGRRLNDMEAMACIAGGSVSYPDESIIVYGAEKQPVFYPGFAILRAVKAGKEDALPERLQQTLAEARRMVAGISGSPYSMTLQIHDLLCRHIRYEVDESTDEDDSCIGAILRGEANCDGYSDAFFLLCGLKGIPARLVSGKAIQEKNPGEDTFHMWNLVLLDGIWRGVDVTWDDSDENSRIEYAQFNMGLDRMRENYEMIEDFLPHPLLEATALQELPVPEFRVSTSDEVIMALRRTAAEGKKEAVLRMDARLFSEYSSADSPVWKWMDLAGISGNAAHSTEERRVTVSDISLLDPGILVAGADSEEEMIRLLRSASGSREIRVYCSKPLYRLYSGEASPVWKWLDLAGISGSVSHSDAMERITISEIVPLAGDIRTASAETESEIVSVMHGASGSRELKVYCSESLYRIYQWAGDPVWKWMDLAGISGKIGYSDTSRMLRITEIAPLDPGIRVIQADSPGNLISALRNLDRRNVKEIRVYCSESLFQTYEENQQNVWKWLKEAGISEATVQYGTAGKKLLFSEIR